MRSDAALPGLIRSVLCKGADCRFPAKGHSMSPFIKDGDVLTISPLSFSPGIGDVVAFIYPETGRLAIHRVIGKRGGFYLIKRDNAFESVRFHVIPWTFCLIKASLIL